MKFEVEVISNEIIKPSSQTPDHLRHYQLSLLDQFSPKTYNPLILFYALDDSEISEISNRIKNSLSEALTLFYPLAGRVKNDRFVDCNDEGILFSEARVMSPIELSNAVKNPNPIEVSKLLPFEVHKVNEFIIGVRLNVFSRGGVAVGLCVSHRLADALSCIAFVKTWSTLSRGGPATVKKPQFVSAELFPPRDNPGFDASSGITRESVSNRFAFEMSKIEEIRAKYGGAVNPPPSRIEALSAFIWKRIAAATWDGEERVFAVAHLVNIRQRLKPPLPENSFGNLYWCAITKLQDDDDDDGEIVKRMRDGIRKVDADFLEEFRESGEDEKLKGLREEATRLAKEGGRLITIGFTSLCRFPLYDADFGFGEPLWVSSATMSFNNVVAFLDAKNGNGIEAYIGLKKEDMVKLQADQEFLKYVSV